MEKNRERRGLIQNDWFKKKDAYLRNHFVKHFGEGRMVNDVSDDEMGKYIDIRMKRCKRKQTIQQEITILKHFYKTYLIKKGMFSKSQNSQSSKSVKLMPPVEKIHFQ